MPRLAPWLARFWRHCNRTDFERGSRALAALGADTLDQFDRLEADGLSFEQHRDGLLMVFREQKTMDAELALLEKAEYGPLRVLTSKGIRDREPALRLLHAGGIHVQPERHLRPELLASELARYLGEAEVDIIEGCEVTGFAFAGKGARGLLTDRGSIEADAFVVATGAEAASLAGRCGARLPIQAGKGYSVTVDRPLTRVNTPLYLGEAMIGVAPFDGALRVAGTMELSGLNLKLDPKRIAALRRAAEGEVPGIFEGGEVKEWVGMRPLTPDGLPVIGRLPRQDNIYIASGHQMMGVLLAPSTGKVVTELILDGRASVDLEPFAPDRFG